MTTSPLEPAYHIFCDEYGDQGLTHSASEWFIVSAVVIASHRLGAVPGWIAAIKEPMKNQQKPELHFTELDERMKLRATERIGQLPIRSFVILSHKKNMIGRRNIRCEMRRTPVRYEDEGQPIILGSPPRMKTTFPNFVLKVLLERATKWCARRSMREYKMCRPAAITIAQRGGFYMRDFKDYLQIDRAHALAKTGTLPGHLDWSVTDLDLITTAPAARVAGLQIADVVSGAFSRAAAFKDSDPRFALNIGPRLARRGRDIAGFGVTGLPWNLWQARLSAEQESFFRSVGYGDEKLVRPGPILPDGR